MAATDILGALALAGVMGMVGQGARAVIGLKKLHEENAAKPPGEGDVFLASRLLVSLFIGFIAGIAAALALDIGDLVKIEAANIELLIGLAAAGYAGTDAIEAFVSRVRGTAGGPSGQPAAPAASPAPNSSAGSAPPPPPPAAPVDTAFGSDVEASMSEVKSEIASLKSMMMEAAPGEATAVLAVGDALDQVTADKVKKMFVPATPLSNIVKHLPSVLGGLRAEGMADRQMLLMALSTIRAETEGFAPISELQSKFNTAQKPFDLYEPGTSAGKKLGNTMPGDGARYRGRGFVQLTGRDNYTRIGGELGVPLADRPQLANDSPIAGRILARFLRNNAAGIRAALGKDDLKEARRLVNGGSHGLDRFTDAYRKGETLFAEGGAEPVEA